MASLVTYCPDTSPIVVILAHVYIFYVYLFVYKLYPAWNKCYVRCYNRYNIGDVRREVFHNLR